MSIIWDSMHEETVHDDIDVDDHDNPMMVTEYINDIFDHLFRLEALQCTPDPVTLTPILIRISVDWIVIVHESGSARPETLFATIYMIYHLLRSPMTITRENIQLVSITSLFTAAKLHEKEKCHIELNDILYVCDKVFSRDEVLDAEEAILDTLDFSINYVTPYDFHYRFNKASKNDPKTSMLSL
jgi:hypothetical protein